MAKKKVSPPHSSLFGTKEFQNIVWGSLCVLISTLTFLSTRESTIVGQYLARAGLFLFGDGYRFIFPPIVGALGLAILFRRASWSPYRVFGLILYFTALSTLLGMYRGTIQGIFDLHEESIRYIGGLTTVLAGVFGLLASLYLVLRISYRTMLVRMKDSIPPALGRVRETVLPSGEDDIPLFSKKSPTRGNDEHTRRVEELEQKLAEIEKKRESEKQKDVRVETPAQKEMTGKGILQGLAASLTKKVPIEGVEKTPALSGTPFTKGVRETSFSKGGGEEGRRDGGFSQPSSQRQLDFSGWDYPTPRLLCDVEHKNLVTPEEIEEKALRIEKTFSQFGISVHMVEESVGPTVIQYRLKPDEGVHLTKLKNLKDNLTLALKAKSIRIQAPIPGLGLVGIEVPNEKRDIVGIKEAILDSSFVHHKSKLALVCGKDVNGDFIVGDLEKMPHLLIAGQTGSGKSVGMNGFILSLLYKNTPSELRMIMIDPKQVELGIYDGIPHLLTPVITSPDKALNALKWGVAEMERRYSTLKPLNARNLEEYNKKVEKKERMPLIVIIIDELADFMMSGNKKEVEQAIARIAQKARAVGIHLILATQRPSVDVITGLIKANIPSRISFTVASGVDSKTVLDQVGAEDLLGMGDMLYSPAGSMMPSRIQGVFVQTEEVERVVNHIKRTIDPEMLEDLYDSSIVNGDREESNWGGSTGGDGGTFEEDPKIIAQAADLVRSTGKCSTSMIQRHLKLGYARAARVVDILEQQGIVGPADGSKPREVIG